MKYTFKGQSHFVLNVCSVKSPKAKDEAGWSAAGTKDKGCVYHRLLSSATIKNTAVKDIKSLFSGIFVVVLSITN